MSFSLTKSFSLRSLAFCNLAALSRRLANASCASSAESPVRRTGGERERILRRRRGDRDLERDRLRRYGDRERERLRRGERERRRYGERERDLLRLLGDLDLHMYKIYLMFSEWENKIQSS